ncbi:related to metallo-beta-lactamase family protein [Rhynchosporium secalis]|uniref:Related to metallo-beta-lactamase family protein n=1 Tax=Rhynchosporium secalis TaxID=38038 RepID=A0A1E1MD38_RHYSE|nr:related to metallo-beta-lactamase family protein [Rhynchosporium secalis]
MSTASTPKVTSVSEPSPTKAQTPTAVDFDTSRFEDLFEAPLHEYNIHTPEASMVSETDNLLICTACGTQFDEESRLLLTRCRICDDPRQFVPRTGQSFTTMGELRQGPYKNRWKKLDEEEDRLWMIYTEPQFAIGQRAILIKTPQGNILWDCIAFLDAETVDWINKQQGGLVAIVISHPHYYTTHLDWAEAFECPVYLAWEDKGWLNRLDRMGKARTFIESTEEEIEVRGEKTGVLILKPGGHFPGSLVCLAYKRLLIADTIVTTPSGKGDWSLGPGGSATARPEGLNTYVFMWSIPNMIPLTPDEIMGIWNVIKKHEFTRTHGAFFEMEVRDGGGGSKTSVKKRMLESMQIQIRASGWKEHALLKEVIE